MTVNTVSAKIASPALLTETWNGNVHYFGEKRVVALVISKAFDRVWGIKSLSVR